MLEAMRILHTAYPRPKRTILVGHWSGEEEGDIGSASFAIDHPEIVAGLQALFNQDNGTGEIDSVQTNGFIDAAPSLARWMARMPADLTRHVALMLPGVAHNESTDSDAFDCRNAPAFFLTSSDWSYGDYTWHTNRDVRQDQLRQREAERDTGGDVRIPGCGGSDVRVAHSTHTAGGREDRRPTSVPKCDQPPRSWAATLRP